MILHKVDVKRDFLGRKILLCKVEGKRFEAKRCADGLWRIFARHPWYTTDAYHADNPFIWDRVAPFQNIVQAFAFMRKFADRLI